MRLGTRGSTLALAQARTVAALLQDAGHGPVEIVAIATAGDRGSALGDKSRWTGALERALAAGEIDLAVHSAKDVPGELGEGLALLGAPARADVEDVLCMAAPDGDEATGGGGDRLRASGGEAAGDDDCLRALSTGARVGTSSLRRAAQLRAARADLEVVDMRGNIDTRLDRLAMEELDAIVLAGAGLRRIGREAAIGVVLPPARFVPAPGQGALALQGRDDDPAARSAVEAIGDVPTLACLLAERALAAALGASCESPLGAWARADGEGRLRLSAWLGLPDGSAWVADELLGALEDSESLGRLVAERMLSADAGDLLQALSRTGAAAAHDDP
ncbi:MAG TPA: hydroxymethylbilane synthase [Solirubrobacteraceae bacterium]|nr:hydroxymethylbilane synthase [Solirubrobacteraceae bacterium]